MNTIHRSSPALRLGGVLVLLAALGHASPGLAQDRTAPKRPTAERAAPDKAEADTLRWSAGARLQADHARFDGVYTRTGASASATYLRRATVNAGLRWHSQWRAGLTLDVDDDGRLEVDTASVSWLPRDGLRLAVGRIDPDFGLDNAISSSWSPAIERSAIWDLVPEIADSQQGAGLRVDAHGRGWHASGGLYDKRERQAAVGRAVWIAEPAFGLVQLGASFALSGGARDDGRLRTRLAVRGVSEDPLGRRSTLAGDVALPGFYEGDRAIGLEAAWQNGPWLVTAEWLSRQLDNAAGAPARSARGQTLTVVWSPSGHSRRHDERLARFGSPQGVGREGAWELMARWDTLSASTGRGAQVLTLGASWLADDIWRVMLNWHQAQSDDDNTAGDTRGQGLALRLQAVF